MPEGQGRPNTALGALPLAINREQLGSCVHGEFLATFTPRHPVSARRRAVSGGPAEFPTPAVRSAGKPTAKAYSSLAARPPFSSRPTQNALCAKARPVPCGLDVRPAGNRAPISARTYMTGDQSRSARLWVMADAERPASAIFTPVMVHRGPSQAVRCNAAHTVSGVRHVIATRTAAGPAATTKCKSANPSKMISDSTGRGVCSVRSCLLTTATEGRTK